jgi:hypothetical protein
MMVNTMMTAHKYRKAMKEEMQNDDVPEMNFWENLYFKTGIALIGISVILLAILMVILCVIAIIDVLQGKSIV